MVTVDVYDGKDIMVLYVPNAFIHTNILPKKYGEERLIIKIIVVLVGMLVNLHCEMYTKHVVFENGIEVICFFFLRDIF